MVPRTPKNARHAIIDAWMSYSVRKLLNIFSVDPFECNDRLAFPSGRCF